jgi:TolA-binding protein
MFRRLWVPVFAAALAMLFVAGGYSPTTVYAASKQEQMLQELQRDVAQLQDAVKSMQRSQDEKFASLQTMVQQSVNVANDANKSVAVIQSSLQQTLREQEGKVVAPVVGLSTHMDSMSNDFRGLQNSVSDLTSLINKMQTQLSDIRDALKVMQTPPPAPPPQPAAATEGGAGAAAVAAPPLAASELYSNAVRDQEAKHYELALQDWAEYLKDHGNTPLAPDAQFYIGLIHYNQGNFETAEQDFDLVLEKYPTDNRRIPQAFYYKGMSLLKLDQKTKAGEEFKQLINQFPRHDLATQACTALKSIALRCPTPGATTAKAPPKAAAKRPGKK